MSPEQKQVVKSSWAKVAPIADTAAGLFYARLFELDPSVAPLFANADMAEQRRKLMMAITTVVNGIDHIDQLVPVIEDMGRRHATYGVTDGHYATVGAALLSTLEQGLGSHWTDDARTAWSDAYGLIAGVMQSAARNASAKSA